jgi:4,5-DOPA dioxygenase extradiol
MHNKDTVSKPVFFGHGSPVNAVARNAYTDFLRSYAQSLPPPDAVIVISAHWQTRGSYITGNQNPQQIYDFYGFPDALYRVHYAPPGSKELAELVSAQVPGVKVDYERGIDHAGWAVVKHLYPDQNIPLLELSLDIQKNPREHFLLGKELRKQTDGGILFIGSGNIVHNLRDITFDENDPPFSWAVSADRWVQDKLEKHDIPALIDYKNSFPDYKRSIPTDEHYLPLLYILGMQTENGTIRTLYEEIQNGSISMRSIEVQ